MKYKALLWTICTISAAEYIPKAYIISTSDSISSEAEKTATYCGFAPQYFAAVRPFDVIFRNDKQYMYENCVGIRESSQNFLNYSQRTSETKFTTSEMALVCSHREVLQIIAGDTTMKSDDWSLVLEEDVTLSPQVNVSTVRNMWEQSLKDIKARSSKARNPLRDGFAYFGMCRGHCKMKSLGGLLGTNCYGLCTHAYAVTKLVAKYLPGAVFNAKVLNDRRIKLDADQALLEYFQTQKGQIEPYLIGFNYIYKTFKDSKMVQSYKGIIIQNSTNTNKASYHGGTSLHSNGFIKTTCFHFHHLEVNVSRKSGPSDETRVSVGDTLFAYASLVGLCYNRSTHPDYCASSYIANDANITAISVLKLAFHIPLPSDYLRCPFGPISSPSGNANVPSSFFSVNGYSPKAVLQPSGTIFTGRLTSPRLFEDSSLAGALLRSRLVFPSFYAARSAKLFLSQEEITQMADGRKKKRKRKQENIVCVLTSIDSISLQKDFYDAALKAFRKMRSFSVFAVFNERMNLWGRQREDHFHDINYYQHIIEVLQISAAGSHVLKAARNISYQMISQHYSTETDRGLILLHRLSQCQNMILSGSALGWWAGWLNRNATIIVPRSENSLANWIQL